MMNNGNYKIGLPTSSVTQELLDKSGLKYEKVNCRETITSVAEEALGAPYIYGASISKDAPRAFDCSSLSGYAYVRAGIALPRISVEQFLFGQRIEEKDLCPGDLVFAKGRKPYFYKETPDGVGHVGIYVGDGMVIHASGPSFHNRVVKEKLKESPQFSPEELRGFRRFLPLVLERFVVKIPDTMTKIRTEEDLMDFLKDKK